MLTAPLDRAVASPFVPLDVSFEGLFVVGLVLCLAWIVSRLLAPTVDEMDRS